MLSHLKFELWRFSKGHWLHFLLAIPGLVLWTVLHESAHVLAVVLQGGQVTKFVWLPTRERWGYVEYNFSDPHFSEFAVTIAPYGFWLLLALVAGGLSSRDKPYPHWVASTIFIWMFVMPIGDIGMPALAYFFGTKNDFTSAFGSPTRVSSMLIVFFGILSVVYGMVIQQRLYREHALSAIAYTLLALVGLAMLGVLHFTKYYTF